MAAKKRAVKKAQAKTKAPAKKPSTRKATTKKSTTKKSTTKKATAKKATAKKAAAKRATAQKQPAKKASARTATSKKAAVKKAAVKKATAKKATSPRSQAKPHESQRSITEVVWNPVADSKRSFERSRPASRVSSSPRRLHLLDVPYQLRDAAKYAGARWDGELKRWVYNGASLPQALEWYRAQPYSWEQWLEDDVNGGWTPRPTPTSSIQLRTHQVDAALAIVDAAKRARPGFLLADDVGLGKTYTTIDAVCRLGANLNVLVLSPLSVVAHWRRSIAAMDGGRNRWCVINYDRVKNLLEAPETKSTQRKRTKNRLHASKGQGIVPWDVVILDEAHKLRNPLSQRSAATRRVIAANPETFCIYLSATAGQNPLELSYLAPVLAHATGSKVRDLGEFEAWCVEQGFSVRRGSFGQWSWVRSEEELSHMNKLLFSRTPPYGLRRRPQDLAGWPELQRIAFPQDLDQSQRALYDAAWEEFRSQMALEQKGKHSKNALTAALRLRQKASLLRCDQTADLAADLVDEGRQVAISVQFIETADRIQHRLESHKIKCVRVTGEQSAAEREEQRIAFQRGEASVVVFTVTEGISLHANEQAVSASSSERALLLHDMRWSALDVAQIEGRCHRDGENAAAWYLFAPDSVEERVARAVLGRLEDMGGMLGDDTTGLDALWSAVGTSD